MRQLSPLIAREAVRPAAATSSPTCRNIVADVLLATQMASASAAVVKCPQRVGMSASASFVLMKKGF